MNRLVRAILPAVAVISICALCSCGKSGTTRGPRQSGGGDPEVVAENRIQKLLGELSSREGEIAKMARVAGPTTTLETRNKAVAARHEFYPAEEYVAVLRAAQAAMQSKVTGRMLERAALENAPDLDKLATNAAPPPRATNAPPNEVAEQVNLKARLLEVQSQTAEIAVMGPAGQSATAEMRERSEAMRDEVFSPDEYIEKLQAAAGMMESKLEGLAAEAAIYEKILGLTSTTNAVPKR